MSKFPYEPLAYYLDRAEAAFNESSYKQCHTMVETAAYLVDVDGISLSSVDGIRFSAIQREFTALHICGLCWKVQAPVPRTFCDSCQVIREENQAAVLARIREWEAHRPPFMTGGQVAAGLFGSLLGFMAMAEGDPIGGMVMALFGAVMGFVFAVLFVAMFS